MRLYLDRSKKYVLGFSGGVDSMVIFHMLNAGGYSFRCHHVCHNHSTTDVVSAEFCKKICADNSVDYTVESIDMSDKMHLGEEGIARKLRYESFARQVKKDETLILGHHMNDQTETILFKIIRGCGIAGAIGMKRETELYGFKIIRPLLREYTKSDILEYAKLNSIKYIEDVSNTDTAFSRNYIRHNIVNSMQEKFPHIHKSVKQFSENMQDAELLLNDLYKNLKYSSNIKRMTDGRVTSNNFFSVLQEHQQRFVLKNLYLQEFCITLSSSHISEIMKYFNRNNKSLTKEFCGVCISLSDGKILFSKV